MEQHAREFYGLQGNTNKWVEAKQAQMRAISRAMEVETRILVTLFPTSGIYDPTLLKRAHRMAEFRMNKVMARVGLRGTTRRNTIK